MSKEYEMVTADKLRVALSLAQVGALCAGIWFARGWCARIENSLDRLGEQFARLKSDAESDRNELRAMGNRLVEAVNRITAIESRSRP